MGSVSVRTHFGRRVAVRVRRAFSELAHEERIVPSVPVPPVGWGLKKSGWWSPRLQQQGLEVWRPRSFGGGGVRARSLGLRSPGGATPAGGQPKSLRKQGWQ